VPVALSRGSKRVIVDKNLKKASTGVRREGVEVAAIDERKAR